MSNGERWEQDPATGEWRPEPRPPLPPWKQWIADWIAHNLFLYILMALLGLLILVVAGLLDVLH
jgi:hypothetical protein